MKKEIDNLAEHMNHAFYEDVKRFWNEVRQGQIKKGAEKYPEPFNPDSWSCDELANHAMQENVDQAVYITGMRDRMRKQEKEIEWLRQELQTVQTEAEYWRLRTIRSES